MSHLSSSSPQALPHTFWYAGLRTNLICYSTVPTHDHILVPETLLKKRKSQEKARAERSAEIEKKKAVSKVFFSLLFYFKQRFVHSCM